MIIGIYGDLGSGKTLFMTLLGYILYNKGYNIMANYHLNFPYQPINLQKIEELNKCAILIDELHIFIDSRRSMSKFNQKFSYFILQTRKRGIIFIYTSQFKRSVDLRIRDITDISILADKNKKNGKVYYTYYIHSAKPRLIKINEDEIKFVYDLYDTNQIIQPIDL